MADRRLHTVRENLILPVNKVSRDGGEYVFRCAHCKAIVGFGGEDLSEIRGEQYQHKACGGRVQVSETAIFVKEL